MTEITDLSTTDASNTSVTSESLEGTVANMGRMDNTLQAIMGLLARSIRTNVMRILDNTDDTKAVAFNASGITTATTRTLTVPNQNGTIATTAAATTDNAVARYDGTAGQLQNSTVTIADTGVMTIENAQASPLVVSRTTSGSASVELKDTGGSVFAGTATGVEFAVGANANLASSPFFTASAASFNVGDLSTTGATFGKQINRTNAVLDGSVTSTSTTTHQRFYNPNGIVGSIQTSGSATLYNTSSDERLKEAFEDFDAGTIIDAIPIYRYKWKVDGTSGYGPKAQELYNVFPDAVSVGSVGDSPGDETFVPWGYDGSKMMALALREIQSLRARVAALEADA